MLIAGCGDDVADTDPPAPSFTEIRDDILIPSCGFNTCHGGTDAGGLTISEDDPGAIYSALVDVPSFVFPEETLVIPGDSENSYLVKKLKGTEGIDGDAMPPPFGLPEEADIDDVVDWINDGAADN